MCNVFFLLNMLFVPFLKKDASCLVEVVESYSQNILGKNIGYYVKLQNNSGKSVDAVEWKATFYNNFNEVKGVRDGDCSSGNIISPVENGEQFRALEGVWVDGATKIDIKITRVHFTDGTSCN